MACAAADRANAVRVDQLTGGLMRAAKKGVGRRSDPQPLAFRQFGEGVSLFEVQDIGLFRIDMFAGFKHLA